MKVRCIAWIERDPSGRYTAKRKLVWCATFRNQPYDGAAATDKTACGHVVILRVGSALRTPTCPECKKRVARRRKPGPAARRSR